MVGVRTDPGACQVAMHAQMPWGAHAFKKQVGLVLCGARATAGRCTLSLGWRATWKRVNPFLTGPVITSCIRHSFRMERQARHPITAAVTSSSAQRSEHRQD